MNFVTKNLSDEKVISLVKFGQKIYMVVLPNHSRKISNNHLLRCNKTNFNHVMH